MLKILFVCSGNICRSPAAEGVMTHLVKEAGLEDSFYIDSAGLHVGRSGSAPDSRTTKVCLAHGIDIRSQRSRPFMAHDFQDFDYIYAMTQEHLNSLQFMRPPAGKLHLFLAASPEDGLDVPDPYLGEHGFELVHGMIVRACSRILDGLIEEHKLGARKL